MKKILLVTLAMLATPTIHCGATAKKLVGGVVSLTTALGGTAMMAKALHSPAPQPQQPNTFYVANRNVVPYCHPALNKQGK